MAPALEGIIVGGQVRFQLLHAFKSSDFQFKRNHNHSESAEAARLRLKQFPNYIQMIIRTAQRSGS